MKYILGDDADHIDSSFPNMNDDDGLVYLTITAENHSTDITTADGFSTQVNCHVLLRHEPLDVVALVIRHWNQDLSSLLSSLSRVTTCSDRDFSFR